MVIFTSRSKLKPKRADTVKVIITEMVFEIKDFKRFRVSNQR